MTFKEKVQEYLKELLGFDTYVEPIMNLVIDHIDGLKLNLKWNIEADGYPEKMFAVILLYVNAAALIWLKKNLPEHFLISYFEERVHGAPSGSKRGRLIFDLAISLPGVRN